MKELEAYRKAFLHLPAHIKNAEAEAEKNDYLSTGMINGVAGGMCASDKTAIFVKATGEKTGMTYTQNLDMNPYDVLEEAYLNSGFIKAEQADTMLSATETELQAETEIQAEAELQAETEIQSEAEIPVHTKFTLLQDKADQLSHAIYTCSDAFTHVEVHITENIRSMGIVNSLGLDRTFSSRGFEALVEVTMEGNAHRSFSLEESAHSLDELKIDYFTEKLKQWMELPTNQVTLSINEMEAVLDGTVLCNILLTAWQMFCGPQYLSRQTPLTGKLGNSLFSDALTLLDDPFAKDSGYARKFDCEGSLSHKTEVVKNGVFRGLLHNLTSSQKMGELSTGNAGRDVNLIQDQTDVRVIPTNFRLLEGSLTKKDLLNKLKDGIYIFESFDMFHSVNIASGDFSIPCKGIIYQDGQALGMCNGLTISGNMMELFAQITDVASDTAVMSMIMSKNFQVMSPSVFVKKIHVTGD